jgi:hypothetical protein
VSAALRLPLQRQPRVGALAEVTETFVPASKGELERAALTRRFDRKFLLRAEHAEEVLAGLGDGYHVVLAGDERFALYDTVYFDTPTLRSYHDHRRGRRPRFKLRIRNYLDRDLSMLEYKEKTARGDTRKLRWKRDEPTSELNADDLAKLHREVPQLFSEGPLHAHARTLFYRLMLINTRTIERATLDFNLTFELGHASRTLGSVVVVEVKDGGRGTASPLVLALRQGHARKGSFSKYCMAVALLGNERANTFRPALRVIEGGIS